MTGPGGSAAGGPGCHAGPAAVAMPPATAGGWVDVDLDALAANYRRLAQLAAPARCAATVKADAYGLGLEPVVRCLWGQGCDTFFVANLDEGMALRTVLPAARVYVFNGVRPEEASTMADAGLLPVLNSPGQVAVWGAFARRAATRPLPCALHVDTGMNRLGLGAEELGALVRRPHWDAGLSIGLLMTHLATAHRPGDRFARRQVALFERLRADLPAPLATSIGNSAGTLLGPRTRGDLVRPGIALYGASPFGTAARPPGLQEVVRVHGRIVQEREVGLQGSVGYGGAYTAAPGTRLLTVGVGYADGYRRVLGNRAWALVGGERAPVVGRVSMDLLTIDVTAVTPAARARAGEAVTLLGGGVSVEELAEAAETISYELLTGLGPRLRRHHRGVGAQAGGTAAGAPSS